jgi:hypothetical protein
MQPPQQPPPYGQAPYPPSAFQPPAEHAQQQAQRAAGYGPPTPPPLQRDVSVMDALRFTTSGSAGWTNILLCGVLYLSTQIIPILGLIVMMGFFAEVHRRLVLQHPNPYLRFDFSDLGPYLSRGVAPFVMGLVLAIPFMFLFVAIAVAVGVAASSGAASVVGGSEDTAVVIGLGGAAILFLPISLFWFALANAATTRAELTGDLSKSFNLGAIWSYAAKTWKRVLITSFLMWFVAVGLMLVGILACVIGLFVTMSMLYIANLHLRWQIYNEYLLEGGEPIELARFETLPSEAQRAPVYAAPPLR